MKLEKIKSLIKHGESNTLEFKKSTAQLKSTGETLCAFLNNKGGTVLIGVNDKGEIIGQHVTERTQREVGSTLAKLAPEVNVEASYIEISKDKNIIALSAKPHIDLQPYTFDSKAYVRLESSTHSMSRDQYQRTSFNNMQQHRSWENGIVEDATIDDLDSEEIMNTISEGVANKRIPANQFTDKPEIALKRLGLLKNGKLTNAAIVLFAKEPTQWFPQCSIRLARFRGIDKKEFIDSKVVDGNVFKIIREAMIFGDRYLPVSSRFGSGTLKRIDEPLFPVDALREVFANAVGHRDYSMYTATLSFAIYDNRLEIWSPGLPPNGVTFDNIKTLHESIPRNHLIAKMLYYNKLFESWGRGIEMIIDFCTQAGHPEPEFLERTGGVCVSLKSKQSIGAPTLHTTPKSPEDLELTAREKEILDIILQNRSITLQDIASLLAHKVTARTIQRDLSRLKSLGLVVMEGEKRGIMWKIKSA